MRWVMLPDGTIKDGVLAKNEAIDSISLPSKKKPFLADNEKVLTGNEIKHDKKVDILGN